MRLAQNRPLDQRHEAYHQRGEKTSDKAAAAAGNNPCRWSRRSPRVRG
ncbi:hypothetical protein [Haloactinospora alba]|nr:hypothetical protein [Haloactinospora alba]